MSCDQTYPFPQVFLVDAGGGSQHLDQQPTLVPCWTNPPPVPPGGGGRGRRRSGGPAAMSPCAALVVLVLFLLAFAGLGFEAYEIYGMKKQLREVKAKPAEQLHAAQKQIGAHPPPLKDEVDEDRPAAHVIGRIESEKFSKTLRWESQVGRAFTSGGVSYQLEDGALRVNATGVYHVYSRVELVFRDCSPASSFLHAVFVRRGGRRSPVTLMEAHRAAFCPGPSPRSWTTESYLASAMQLQSSDRVYVNVSHPAFLSHAHYANFFGLYKI